MLKLLELTKAVDYVVKAGDDGCEPYVYGYSQLVLGNTDTKEVDRVDIYLSEANF